MSYIALNCSILLYSIFSIIGQDYKMLKHGIGRTVKKTVYSNAVQCSWFGATSHFSLCSCCFFKFWQILQNIWGCSCNLKVFSVNRKYPHLENLKFSSVQLTHASCSTFLPSFLSFLWCKFSQQYYDLQQYALENPWRY